MNVNVKQRNRKYVKKYTRQKREIQMNKKNKNSNISNTLFTIKNILKYSETKTRCLKIENLEQNKKHFKFQERK